MTQKNSLDLFFYLKQYKLETYIVKLENFKRFFDYYLHYFENFEGHGQIICS